MPSIVPGFEYDIFISYRHNDNRSGWVTEFVHHLNEELASTIKEPVSVYFDSNPHDGLLETHNVDKSLERKLKCLIFIPILSQTYCDSKSFAWQNEFCVFNLIAQDDEFGIDIELPNGNVASRILPIKIHDLDADDKRTIEKEIGGVLRSIDFIFKSPGVNRPLAAHEDHLHDNQNKIYYRDQINKVAMAVKELIQGIKNQVTKDDTESGDPTTTEQSRLWKKIVSATLFFIAIFSGYYVYKEVVDFKKTNSTTEIVSEDKSLIVLPFADLSPQKDQEWFSDGLTEELLNNLSSLSDLRLISSTTSFSFKGKGLAAKAIADSIGVSHVLEGSVRKVDNQLKVTVQLIRAADDAHMWSHVYDYKMDSVFRIQMDIAKTVARLLNLLLDVQTHEQMITSGTNSVEAYEEYLKGNAIYQKAHVETRFDLLTGAMKYFEKAIRIDPHYAEAYNEHADIYVHDLLGAENFKSNSHLSDQTKYDSMMSDIHSALHYAKSPSKRLRYGFASQFFSRDWSQIASFLQVKEKWESGFAMMLAIRDPEFVSRHYLQEVKMDPYRELSRAYAAPGLVITGKYDSALLLIDNLNSTSRISQRVKPAILLQKGDYAKALSSFETVTTDNSSMLLLLKLLNRKYSKSKASLYREIQSLPLVSYLGENPIMIYNALGDYKRADSLASVIDSKILGHCILANSYVFFGLYFHLNATPNFSARLQELGVDVKAFEKKYYKTLPVVKLN